MVSRAYDSSFSVRQATAALSTRLHRRYETHHLDLNRDGDRTPLAGGRMIAALSAFATCAALVSITAVLLVVSAHHAR